MPETVIIGISGKARAGKDSVTATLIECFKEKHGLDARRYALADPLKKFVNEEGAFKLAMKYGIEWDNSPDLTDPLCPPPYGKQSRVLQFVGEARRSADPFYWVKRLAASIEADKPQIAVVSDVRYCTELFFILNKGGIAVRVRRPGFVDLSRDPNHPSETELDGYGHLFAYDLVNDGTLEQLKADAADLCDLIVNGLTPPEHTNEDFEVVA